MEEDIGKKIDNFEKILKTYCGSKSLLYRDKLINEKESQGLRPEDVIKNISKQIKVLNHNETLSKTVNDKLKTYKESRLTSINNMFSLELEPQQNHPVASNFENQWGFDTQLIVATKDAEAIKELHTGVTQEFETSFDQKPEIMYSQGKVNIDNKGCSKSALKINISSPHQILQDTVLNNCNLSHLGNEDSNNDNAVDDCNLQDLVSECDTISSSPILFSKNEKECHNTSFLLESFEKFEAIAAPIVYENSDVEAVKKIINLKFLHNNQAQVTSEEIQYEDKNYETASIHLSPILKLKTDQEEIMRHINCHLSNKGDFLDEDIIFSSDEKTELDYNEVEELPLTCALQTSFYEQEYDLDKTIYVGFQTASNKSIQVLTNSFTKAKSILNDCYKISKPIQSLSLSELVEVYDSATMEKKGDYKSQKTSFDTGCGAKENVFNSSFHNNDKEHKPLDFGHFDDRVLLKTNKAVICTQEQIKIDDYMMQEFEENMSINDNKLHTNSDVSKHPVIFNRAEQLMLNDNTNAHSDYCSVPNSTSDNEQYKTSLEEKLIENLGMDDETMYQNNYERDKMNKNGNVKNELLTGFKTASNKCINISKASLVKSKEILEEVNIESNLTTDNLHAKMVKNKKFQGFRTASQKPIKISDKAYVESDKIFQSNQFPLVMNENQNYNKKGTTENTQNNSQIFEIENSKIDTHSGFKTASNNSIHVSRDALLISKKFLQEFNFDDDIVINNKKELVSEKETLRLITEGSYSDSNNPVSVSETDFENTKNKLEEFCLKKYSEKDDKVGSMKEKNDERKKSLQFSDDFSTFTDTSCLKNLSNTKRILVIGVDQEIEDKLHNKESFAYAGLTTASNKRPKMTMESSINSKNAIDNITCELTNSINAFQGFKTANNKPVKISDEALEKSKKLFQDINNCDSMLFQSQNKEASNSNTLKDSFQGFMTASNNPVRISDEALEKSKKKFQDINNCDSITPTSNSEQHSVSNTLKNTFQGFKTASNNPVRISDEALEKSKKKFQDINNCDSITPTSNSEQHSVSNTLKNTFQGFKTASNNPVRISDEALEKSKKIFQDINNCDSYTPKSITKQTSVSNTLKNTFQSFKTASNNPVKISDEALEKSKKMFLDKNNCDSVTSKTHSKKANVLNTLRNTFQGFKTASNNPVRISDEALEKSKKIFQDINNCDSITPTSNSEQHSVSNTLKNTFQGFKTASNNPVRISDEALEKSKKKFQDINNCDSITPTSNSEQHSVSNTLKNTFQGFKTASNNPVRISDEALEKSKKIFQDINNCDSYTPKSITKQTSVSNTLKNTFQSFKTASNNPVKISDEALEKSKKMFLDKNNCDSVTSKTHSKKANVLNTLRNTFQGFKTASNNPVRISDEALEKSKKIFQDINNCDSITPTSNSEQHSVSNTLKNTFQGFKTASNNPVRISDEALEKSKKIFQDINNCDSITPTSNSEQHSVSNTLKNTFQGFKTASNNPVKISDEALEKSKKIFKDMNNYNDSDSMIFEANSKEASVLNTLKNTFQSFKTASNNPVQISDEVLEKCKTCFQDIIVNSGHHLLENNSIETASYNKIETANNNTLSKEDLRKSKTVFEETENNLKTMIKQKLKDTHASMHTTPVETNINVHVYERNKEARKCFVEENKTTKTNITDVCNLLNTEVVNNFNETMLTEDFINKSPSNKRSGSPILSCPRPKKIKTKLVHEPVLEKSCEPIDKTNRFTFNANYKKQKKYKLLDVYEMDKVTNAIKSKEVNYDINNISSLEFVGARNELSDSKWTLDNITTFFLESVNKTIIPNGWVNNQIKLITLKLLSYEKRFPNSMQNVCSVSNVMEQLKYRYDRELYNVERPALRKILEKDEVPSRRMVLQVLNIYKNGSNVTDTSNSAENIELLLTDGWYCVKATLDKLLTKLVCEGKITIGMKLVTHGAELLHCEQGVAPWEDTSSVRLKISGNSTRRAHWAAKLGFHGNGAILSYLTTVKPEGGKISQLRVIATRVYPMLYVEKFDDGSTVTRSERLENLHQMKYEMERETMLEKIYEEVEKEFCMQASQCDSVEDDRKSLESGSQIYQLLKKSRDPAEFRASLTYSQSKILQDYIDKRREISLQDLQSKVQSLLKKRGLNVTRNVVAMLKMRVADVYEQNVTKAVITVWRPHESLLHLLREGTWLDIHNVVPTAVRYSEIQISAGKQSMFRKTSKVDNKMLNIARTFQRKCHLIQELTQNPYLTTDYNEVDTVGFVFDVEPSVKEFDCKKELFQNVFLADANKKIICINFWGGLKKFGFDSILETGQVVACINLQKRSGNTRKNIPHYRATEFTYFTKTPKIDVCRKACEDLSKQFLSLDRRKFVQDCIILRNNLVNIKYGNIDNISPYRFNNSDYNLSKNKIFINSPNGDPNLNLNGLDFDSTFQQSDATLSPKALLRKKEVNERIAKLRKYGEPPPLGPIHIVNKSRDAIKPYRSLLISKAESSKLPKSDQLVAVKPQTASTSAVDDHADENTNENRCTSPVLPFKRTVNPARLNFSKQKNASKDDPFGEDFETSPPLSLD